mmetsp:Transcript_110899/g.320514  ORF Transcript_110899/g.320514 Transcript_110899/m.320514 type:complete len:373 (+) Transcript_110899:141-1259(+)
MGSLSRDFVVCAIRKICTTSEKSSLLKEKHDTSVEFLDNFDSLSGVMDHIPTDKEYLSNKTPWHFGLALRQHDNSNQVSKVLGCLTFYIAYSSWSGRILYVDRLECKGLSDEAEMLLMRMLAEVALSLNCARLTWRHTSTPEWHLQGENRPEMHGEVLTLSRSDFVSDPELKNIASIDGDFSNSLVGSAFSTCFEALDTEQRDSGFRLRRAGKEDIGDVGRLVQGLADYVKESEAVEMTPKDYLEDGFHIDNPLWYCILIDKVADDGSSYTCGFAFIFAGYVLGQGRFLYLEDLFVEPEYRGSGAGKLTMKALFTLCRAMNCSHLYWQALDWNTASLNFYERIGAKIHEGEKTSRYAGDALEKFANLGTGSC